MKSGIHRYLDVLHGVPFFVIESELDGGMVSTARAVAQSLVKETYTPWRGFEPARHPIQKTEDRRGPTRSVRQHTHVLILLSSLTIAAHF